MAEAILGICFVLLSMFIFIIYKKKTKDIREQALYESTNIKEDSIPQSEFKKQLQKKSTSSNCDGCPKQSACEYGYVTYDRVGRKRMTLWEKYIMLQLKNIPVIEKGQPKPETDINNPIIFNKKIADYRNKLSDQHKFTINDIEWLTHYLELERLNYDQIRRFGKCGIAYAKFDNLKGLLRNIENALKKAKRN